MDLIPTVKAPGRTHIPIPSKQEDPLLSREQLECLSALGESRSPRYTSYPTALDFKPLEDDVLAWEALTSIEPTDPLSLYVHVPFCERLCYYCACNKVLTKHKSKSLPYMEALFKEIELKAVNDDVRQAPVRQVHFGGGTPNFLSPLQLGAILDELQYYYRFDWGHKAFELSIEVDPRSISAAEIPGLRALGFNRLSLGVQDFDPDVQNAIHRVQPYSLIESIVNQARKSRFKSINMDLIYGLPKQSISSFLQTIDQVIELNPDRISIFHYAHLPDRFPPQRRFSTDDLPSSEAKANLFHLAKARLQIAGYRHIGLDHFAKESDPLCTAQDNQTLHRNFQGYSTHRGHQLIGFGPTAISCFPTGYVQNQADLAKYERTLLTNEQLPVSRGIKLTNDDKIRQWVIQQLMCHFHLDGNTFLKNYDQSWLDYFAGHIHELSEWANRGCLTFNHEGISILDKGRYFIRDIVKNFDQYRTHSNTPCSKSV